MAQIRSEDAIWSYHENSSSALTDAVVQAAPGPNLSIYITDIIAAVSTGTALEFVLESGTTTTIMGPYAISAVSTMPISLHTPKKLPENTALTITSTGTSTKTFDIFGFIGKS